MRLVDSIHCLGLDTLIFSILGIVRWSDTAWSTAERRSLVFDSRFGPRTKQPVHANGLICVTRKGFWPFSALLYREGTPQTASFMRHVTLFLPMCSLNVNKESSRSKSNDNSFEFSQFDWLLPDP
jgi:hypothetical protein